MANLAYTLFRAGAPGPDTAAALTEHGEWSSKVVTGIGEHTAALTGDAALRLASRGSMWAALVARTTTCGDTLGTLLDGEQRVTIMRAAATNPVLKGDTYDKVRAWALTHSDADATSSLFKNPALNIAALTELATQVGGDRQFTMADALHAFEIGRQFTMADALHAFEASTPTWYAAFATRVFNTEHPAHETATREEYNAVLTAFIQRDDTSDVLHEAHWVSINEHNIDALTGTIADCVRRAHTNNDTVRFVLDTPTALRVAGELTDAELDGMYSRTPYNETLAARVISSEDPNVVRRYANNLFHINGFEHASRAVIYSVIENLRCENLGDVSTHNLIKVLELVPVNAEQILALLRATDSCVTNAWMFGKLTANLPTSELVAELVHEPGNSGTSEGAAKRSELTAEAIFDRRDEATRAVRTHGAATVGLWWEHIPGVFCTGGRNAETLCECVASALGARLNEAVGDNPNAWVLAAELLSDNPTQSAVEIVTMVTSIYDNQ